MRRLMASNPDARLADWAARSEWARDTDGDTDEEGSPLRAQEGAWRQLWEAAAKLAAPRGEAGNSVGAGEGSTFTSGTEVRVPALGAGEAIGGGSKPASEGIAAQLSTTMPATSSSAAWLAQRHMNALMRGTSVGSAVRIAVGRPVASLLLLAACGDVLPWHGILIRIASSCGTVQISHFIQELGAMQQQTDMDAYEDPSLEDLRAERV